MQLLGSCGASKNANLLSSRGSKNGHRPRHCCVQVPLTPPKGAALEERQVVCWEWKGMARDEGDAAAAWFTKVLGKPTRLVRFLGAPAHAEVQACRCLEPPFRGPRLQHALLLKERVSVLHACRAAGHE